MAFPDLPRSYLLKKAHKELSASIEIEAIPHGAVRPFKSTLAAALAVEVNIIIMHKVVNSSLLYVLQLKDADTPASPIIVKLSGDGARFSKSSSFVLFSFSFPTLSSNVLAASGMLYMYSTIPYATCNYFR